MANENNQDDNGTGDKNQGNGGTDNTKMVNMSQSDLDALINSKFAQGATKSTNTILTELGVKDIDEVKAIIQAKIASDEANQSELEKANSKIESLTNLTATLEAKISQVNDETFITDLASKHGIKEVDYFKFKYNEAKAKGGDSFNDETFITDLLKSNGVFGGVKIVPNPPNQSGGATIANPITMDKYLQLSSEDRKKYKATDLVAQG